MKTKIALLGATGTVGQKVIKMLENNPSFEISELVASEKNIGKKYSDVVNWRESGEIPTGLKELPLIDYKDVTTKYVISSLPGDIAKIAEMHLAEKGIHVVSNASAYRTTENVPLVIPEINGDHLSLLSDQKTPGKILTNPNCAIVFLCLGLAPLKEFGEIESVSVVTLQAVSGAGYPGVPSLDMIGNTVPNIGGAEEEKIEWEAKKILGGAKSRANFDVTAHVNRVPVANGHTVAMHVYFKDEVDINRVHEKFAALSESKPELYKLHTDEFRPQPVKDITEFDQRAHIGRIKQGENKRVVGLVSMGHNLVRGAAGAAILNLELLHNHLEA